MSIEFEVSGITYTQITSASVTIRLDALVRTFRVDAAAPDGLPLPFKGNESCRLIVDGTPVLTGFIETVDVSYDKLSHRITLTGRGKTCDLVDSTLRAKSFSSSISLKQLAEDVIQTIGADITVTDDTDIAIFNPNEDKIGISTGENAFSYLEKLARKRQVILTSTADGNIAIVRASGELNDVNLINNFEGDENNIKSAKVSYDFTKRFNVYEVRSQANASSRAWEGSPALSDMVDQNKSVIDDQVREGRLLVIKAEKSSSVEQCNERAKWEANIRQTRSIRYNCVVAGNSTEGGDVWDINILVNVIDVFADISAQMLIDSITFNYSADKGSTTELSLVERESYTLKEPDGPDPKTERNWLGTVGDSLVNTIGGDSE